MTRALIAFTALIALAVPTALAAPPAGKGKPESPGQSAAAPGQSDDHNAAKKCKKLRAEMGVEPFRARYGTNPNKKNAFGKCVAQQEKKTEEAEEREARENAAKKCKKLRAEMGVEPFRARYGTNPNKKNAFGKCVAQHAQETS